MFSPNDVLAAQSETGVRHSALTDRSRKLPGGLGRFAAVDPRDKDHGFGAVVAKRVPVKTKTWAHAPALDQGQTSRCVAFAFVSWLGASPMATRAKVREESYINALYATAQRMDEWPGEDYNGTSVRAGAKALQAQGRIAEYLWGSNVAELKQFVLSRGTVVIGSDWHEEMFFPEEHGGYLVPEGPVAGGHAWLVIGYNATKKAFRVLNSWGKDWGDNGMAWIKEADMEVLCSRGAEMCSAIEKKA